MNIRLESGHEQLVRALVQRGRFASEGEVIGEALRLLERRERDEQARVIAGIRQGIEDRDAGRSRPADVVMAEIRRDFDLPLEA